MSFKLELVQCGVPPVVIHSALPNLAACTEAVAKLDAAYEAWEAAGFPPIPDDDPRAQFEGCDLYAYGTDGTQFYFTEDDVWEVLP